MVNDNGLRNCRNVDRRNGGARPALPFSSISSIPTNGESGKRAKDGVLEVEYGYYPQKAVSRDMQERLERAYRSGNISKTRKRIDLFFFRISRINTNETHKNENISS